jgi:hypothetical protein
VLGGHKLRAILRHADGPYLIADTELVQERQIGWQQRLADVEARMVLLLEERYLEAPASQADRGGGAARAATDDEHVGRLLRHESPSSPIRIQYWFGGVSAHSIS